MFTILASIAAAVLICTLPQVAALIVITMSGAIFTILPTVHYIIMLLAIRYHNFMVQDMVPSVQLQGILRRERKVAKEMFIVFVVLSICVIPKFCDYFRFSVIWQPLP